jgi:hypothetical protein
MMGLTMKQHRAVQMLRSTIQSGMACTVLAFVIGGPAIAETIPTVNVGVFAQHSAGKIVYYYRVTNNTQQTIAAVAIGLDNQNDGNPGDDAYELAELPSGWNAKFGIPTTSSNSPTGWRVSLVTPEKEGNTHAVSWEPQNDRTPKLLPGQTLTKMSVAVDKADANYLTGHALITFTDGTPATLTVPLGRLDNTPPDFSVNFSPNTILTQANKYAAINATFLLKDDYDRSPEIRLESITANEPLEAADIRDASIGLDDRYLKFRATSKNPAGRIYTVTYSATDASGNQTMASATVTVIASAAPSVTPAPVPLDQGEMK